MEAEVSDRAKQIAVDFQYLREHCGHPLTKTEDTYQYALQLMRLLYPTKHEITRGYSDGNMPPHDVQLRDPPPELEDEISLQTTLWL